MEMTVFDFEFCCNSGGCILKKNDVYVPRVNGLDLSASLSHHIPWDHSFQVHMHP